MNDTPSPVPDDDPTTKRQRGPKRRTSFGLGIVIGLALGITGGIVVPDLFPEGEPDCVLPQQVTWLQNAGDGVRLEVDYAGDGTNGCDANIVFSERPQP